MAAKKKTKAKTKAKRKRGSDRKSVASAIANSLVKYDGGLSVHIPGKVTPVQLSLFDHITYQEATQALLKVAQVRDGGNWWVGDALNFMESHFGETYAQAATEAGISEDTLQILQSVSARVAPENRFKELTWSHHRLVAKMEPEEQVNLLKKAIAEGMSVREFAQFIKGAPAPDEDEGDGGAGKSTQCECCAAPNAKVRVCGECASKIVGGMAA